MPTYQYACSACQHEFEIFQAFTDTSLTHCPECNGQLRKVYSPVGVVFKGSGFYKTDSGSSSKAPSTASAAPSSSSVAPAAPSSTAPAAPTSTTAPN
ncbi:MAG TPA: FmdB family zinc ribbon protein [Candidatus Paceibacterota bacterium]|nr:FmdB family zinc ribbon protein [Candidatus Paceibacterota bacterium]